MPIRKKEIVVASCWCQPDISELWVGVVRHVISQNPGQYLTKGETTS